VTGSAIDEPGDLVLLQARDRAYIATYRFLAPPVSPVVTRVELDQKLAVLLDRR
jgi:hypothetical protein